MSIPEKKIVMSINKQNGDSFPLFEKINLDDQEKLPDSLQILPLRNTVLFPGMVIPISVGRKKSVKLVSASEKTDKLIGVVTQIDTSNENPKFEELYKIGTAARVLKIFEMPDGSKTAIIRGIRRFVMLEEIAKTPQMKVLYNLLPDVPPTPEETEEFDALIASLRELADKMIQLSEQIPKEASFAVKNIDEPDFLFSFIANNLDAGSEAKQKVLEINNLKERAEALQMLLSKELRRLELKDNIQNKVKTEIDHQQREYYLNQQMKAIQEELGLDTSRAEIDELEAKAKNITWSKEAQNTFEKQIKRLKQMNPMSPDYGMQTNYLQTLTELPWGKFSKDNFDLARAKKILDEDHFGLEKVKDRILEHLAVLKLKGDLKAPILCLYGPPGVGKTSLGRSIARALNRKYARMSLGGLHDEAEIRGHRRTYIGAMPGRIIQSLKKMQTSNPVFILDEIDKIGNDFRGDPSSALLEVLDPEQNNTFYDNYLEVEYDLSKILFIATANSLSTIKPALRDRMELIDVSGYVVEEKVNIAINHLIPKQLADHGIKKNQLTFEKSAVETIISSYTRESGVRALDKKIAEAVRKTARFIAMKEPYQKKLEREHILPLLGTPDFQRESYEGNEFAGVAVGLAWTSVGGTILYVESAVNSGGGKLTLTGNLGNVMKESATIALEFIKSNAEKFGIDERIFNHYGIHLHVPEGATPKDGPSAGITMVTSMLSAYTQRKVRANLAMTGEISLRGRVLPVGGIKEKILAAKRAGITDIILCKDNKKDILDIKPVYTEGLTFHYAETIEDIINIALLAEQVAKPKLLKLPENRKPDSTETEISD